VKTMIIEGITATKRGVIMTTLLQIINSRCLNE
jgi:hypothetical protein